MVYKFLILIVVFSISTSAFGYNQTFSEAKKNLIIYYKENPRLKTFYCDCNVRWLGKKGIPQVELCGYEPRNQNSRSDRVEWEHVMPASWFGQQLQCWQNGGRSNCIQNSEEFRIMEGDMHNIFPVIGELNNDRSNFRFGIVRDHQRNYGRCDFKVDFQTRVVEPKDDIKGDIARVMLYMKDQYGLRISQSDLNVLNAWSLADPISQEEIDRNNYIKSIQGNSNPYIEIRFFDRVRNIFKAN